MLVFPCVVDIDSTPPAIMQSENPLWTWVAAIATVCKPDEQYLFTVVPPTSIGNLDNTAAFRAMLCPWAPSGAPQPRIMSSTIEGSKPGFLSNRALTKCAVISSARVWLNPPLKDLANPVRTLSTITTFLIKSPIFVDSWL